MESRLSSLSLSESTHQSPQNSGVKSSPSSVSVSRLWRPAAQRNMKNQWSRLNSLRHEWISSSSTARSHATSLVNAYLSQRYMKDMELGVLSDMADIQKKACLKLLKQQVLHQDELISSYKDMVTTVVNMVNTSASMRCFLKGATNSPFIQFSSTSEDTNDNGDGGGIPVFTFYPISTFEKLAWEMVEMFKLELYLKRLLVIEFLSLRSKEDPINKRLCWSDEIYEGEFGNLSRCNLDHREAPESTFVQPNFQPDSDILQVYLTAWLTDVNIDKLRVDDIFSEVGEDMHVNYV
ncbi:uncharacterized protein LOC111891081 [Lactuca sativa]|uniref:uncharacterized protein LOC111891081 n=1 Tax=Lactuca sativa TaxID=4236 RepID=UPI000CD8DE66|nr:uncharacterized protein LOC111891081 [Lactuca sativa]